jgi:glutathione S-transferase
MEPILLYGIPAGSSPGLIAALEWLGKPYSLCRVDMLGEMREAVYARVNARHETPVLITDAGHPLTETIAIANWLEARDSERKVSFDPLSPQADRMHQLMAFVNTGFTGAYSPLWTIMESPNLKPEHQTALREYGVASVIERHDKLEAMLDDSPCAVGNRPTLADAILVGVARWLDIHEVADPKRWPRLQQLRSRLESDAAVQYALSIENGERPAGTGACKQHVDLKVVIQRYGTTKSIHTV